MNNHILQSKSINNQRRIRQGKLHSLGHNYNQYEARSLSPLDDPIIKIAKSYKVLNGVNTGN